MSHKCTYCGKEFEGNVCPQCGKKWGWTEEPEDKRSFIKTALIIWFPFIVIFVIELLYELTREGIIQNEIMQKIFLFDIPWELPEWLNMVLTYGPGFIVAILILAAVGTLFAAQIYLIKHHKATFTILDKVRLLADEQKERNWHNTTDEGYSASVNSSGDINIHHNVSTPVFNGWRILQYLLWAVVIVLTPILYPIYASRFLKAHPKTK